MTDISERPTYDSRPIPETTPADLDPEAVKRFVDRLRRESPHDFGQLTDEEILLRKKALARAEDGVVRPSLAGMLVFSKYPQEFLPSCVVAFTVPKRRPDGGFDLKRPAADNVTLVGSIDAIIADASDFLKKHLMPADAADESAVMKAEGLMRAVREAIVNALVHRDYSPISLSTRILVQIWPDVVVVMNRKYRGSQVPDTADGSSNPVLHELLSGMNDLNGAPILSERGSGIGLMSRACTSCGLGGPIFETSGSEFRVAVFRH